MANNQLLASDAWISGALASGWSAITGLLKTQVVSAGGFKTEANALSTEAGQIYTGITWPNDQISEATITLTSEATTNFQLVVRGQSGAYSGYKVAIGNSTATIYRMDAGVATQLATVSSLGGFNIGDLWQFMAAGSVLIVYFNGKRVLYAADDTYPTGSPGFIQFSSTDITHSQGIAWRGYSSVQQDGIWQKRGVIIPLKAADIANSGFGVWNVSYVDFGPAQLLSGTVYKMWFNGQGQSAGNPGATFYAESTDGISWTRRGSAVLTNFTIESMAKSGGLYYGFGQTGQAQGSGSVNVYTSPISDGLTWTLAASGVLSLGTAGQWDAGNLYVQANPVLLNGTWYMLYGGAPSPNSPVSFNSGIATSPDLLTWTKYAGNPVLSPGVSGPVIQVGSTFYTWTAVGPGPNNTRFAGNAFNPAETVRVSSTDMLNWSATRFRSLHASQLYESVNDPHGNSTSCIILDIGGRAYNYLIGAPSDSVAPQYYQISLAIGPASIAQIITQPEDGTVQTATQTFTGAGDLPAPWTTPVGGVKLTLVAGKVRATTTGAYNVMYNAGTFPADHYSEITIPTLADNSSFACVGVRIQSGSNSGYLAQIQGAFGTLQSSGSGILKLTNGATTTLPVTNSPLPALRAAAGDVFRLSVTTASIGTSGAAAAVLSLFQNGALVHQAVDYSNTYPTGQPGIGVNTGTLANTELSVASGGSAGVLPAYSGGSGTQGDMLTINRWCTRLWG